MEDEACDSILYLKSAQVWHLFINVLSSPGYFRVGSNFLINDDLAFILIRGTVREQGHLVVIQFDLRNDSGLALVAVYSEMVCLV